MGQPSTQDFTAPFDPTAYTQIDGAQLLQYLQGAYPGTDVGLVITTTDTAGNPNVPDATTNTKWKKYIWQRISPTTNSITLYVWNPNAAADITFLYWTPAFAAAIGSGTIQGYQIAPNTITDGNIANVNWSKITGAPTSLPPSGAAGPTVLSGTYPDPSIANLAITTAMVAQNAITGGAAGKLATGANGATLGDNLAPTAGSTLGSPTGGATALAANDRVVVNAAKTGYCTVQKVIDALAEPAVGDANKVIQVNGGGTGFTYGNASAMIAAYLATQKSNSGNLGIPASGGTYTYAHGLGATPTKVRAVLVCTTIDRGYAVGDEVDVAGFFSANPGFAVGANATNGFVSEISTATPSICPKTGGAVGAITAANWQVKIYCEL